MPAVSVPQLTAGGVRIGRDRLQVIFGPMFADACNRIVSNEVAAVRRAITENLEKGNLKRFHDWISRFYKRHAEFYLRTLTPPLHTYAVALTELLGEGHEEEEVSLRSVRAYLSALANLQISLSMGELARIISTTAEESLPKAMSDLTELWERDKPGYLAGQMMNFELVGNALPGAGGNGNAT